MPSGKAAASSAESEKPPSFIGIGERSLLSQTLLLWCTALVRSPPTAIGQLPSLPSSLTSHSLQAELADAKPGSILSRTFSLHAATLYYGLATGVAHGLLATVLRSWLLMLLVDAVEDADTVRTEHLLLVCSLTLTLLVEGLASTVSKHWLCDRLGCAFFVTAGQLIQRISLLGSSSTELSASELIGLDLPRGLENGKFLSFVPMGLAQVVGGSGMLVWLLGYAAALCGVGAMLFLTCINFWIAGWIKKEEQCSLAAADKRLSLMKQLIFGVQAVKLSAWEEPFTARILSERDEECTHIRKKRFMEQWCIQMGRACPIVGAGAAFLYLGLNGSGDWKSSHVFAGLSVFHAMRMGIIMLPQIVALLGAVAASTERIDSFLNTEQKEAQNPLSSVAASLPVLVDATLTWQDLPVIHQLSLTVQSGECLAVVGEVGSGKSSLLQSMLGELVCLSGTVSPVRPGSVAYVPQLPLVIAGTILDNILMGRSVDTKLLDIALQASQLTHDVGQMPAGLQTRVGERGQSLSGGQQARLGLARALYSPAALLVLDDPMAAVDPRVACAIFEAVHALTPQHTVVMALNQAYLAERCDRVATLKEGRLSVLTARQGRWQPAALQDKQLELTAIACLEEDTVETEVVAEESLQTDEALPLKRYAAAMGIWLWAGITLCLLTYTFMLLSDRWLAKWINELEASVCEFERVGGQGPTADSHYYGRVYGLLCTGFLVCAVGSSFLLSEGSVRAGSGLHVKCVHHLMHAPLAWFEKTVSGRILSRFSSDLGIVDSFLPMYIDNVLQFGCTLLALVALVLWILPYMAPVIVVGMSVYVTLVFYVQRANHACKQLSNHAMAPVMSAVQETVSGQVLMRAMQLESFCIERFDTAVDNYNKATLCANATLNWGMQCSYLISSVMSTCSAVIVVTNMDSFDASEAGLALAYSFTIPYFLLFFSFNIVSCFMYLASLQRLLQYMAVPQEPAWHTEKDKSLPDGWPLNADIVFSNVVLKYNDTSPPALRGLSVTIEAGQRVGVAGRTGAGKSSLLAVLFRSRDATSGLVTIGGVDLRSVGIQMLRKRLAVIPQRPVLIAGTVRTNLDPFGDYGLEESCTALRQCGLLKDKADAEQLLECPVNDLSTGQQQLLTLARAMLRCVSILCMDEPTSQVDPETDANVQRTIREQLRPGTTVITIAHRIESILNYDKILVMQDGQMLEWGAVDELRGNEESELCKLIRMSTNDASDKKVEASPDLLVSSVNSKTHISQQL